MNLCITTEYIDCGVRLTALKQLLKPSCDPSLSAQWQTPSAYEYNVGAVECLPKAASYVFAESCIDQGGLE